MSTKQQIALQVLLNKYHEGRVDEVIGLLPEEIAESLRQSSVTSQDINSLFTNSAKNLTHYHYSWLIPALNALPVQIKKLTLNALPEDVSSKLCKLLHLNIEKASLSPPIKTFLLNHLYDKIDDFPDLPLTYAPSSQLSEITTLSKDEIIELANHLALIDLSHEVKHVVDKRVWTSVNRALSAKKRAFLKQSMKLKKTVSAQRPLLREWKGDSNHLRKILQRRGLRKLGLALSGEHPTLVWHLIHKLDTGRGKVLLTTYSTEEYPKVTLLLKQETQKAIKQIKQEKS